jgi:chromosome segregation ATPase
MTPEIGAAAVDLATAAAIADTLRALSKSCELIAERVSQVDTRNEQTLKIVAALADRLERAADGLKGHRGELDNLEARLDHAACLYLELGARVDNLEARLAEHSSHLI